MSCLVLVVDQGVVALDVLQGELTDNRCAIPSQRSTIKTIDFGEIKYYITVYRVQNVISDVLVSFYSTELMLKYKAATKTMEINVLIKIAEKPSVCLQNCAQVHINACRP